MAKKTKKSAKPDAEPEAPALAVPPAIHQDVEYAVDVNGHEGIFQSFDAAAVQAVQEAMRCGEAVIDVLVSSEEGAKHVGGSDAVEQYLEDPEASVFQRYELKINLAGRVS